MAQILDRPIRVMRKRLRQLQKYAPYLAGKSAPKILIDEIYLGILGHPGDPHARAKATRDLKEGRRTVLQIVHSLVPPELRNADRRGEHEVAADEIYRAVLGREPTAAERRRIVGQLNDGGLLGNMILQVLANTEARQALFAEALKGGGVADLILAHQKRVKGQ